MPPTGWPIKWSSTTTLRQWALCWTPIMSSSYVDIQEMVTLRAICPSGATKTATLRPAVPRASLVVHIRTGGATQITSCRMVACAGGICAAAHRRCLGIQMTLLKWLRCMFSMVDMPTGTHGAGTSTSSVLGAGIRVFPGSFRPSSMCAVIQTRGTALTLSEATSCAPTPSLRGGESRWFASTSEIGGRHSVPARDSSML
mmetsp:Transcript_38013/g.113778  ORF Transcript_38013/g.113778 Transcript_38013/m.113778 type:complete len:200 (+) Transcript_38013:539-1138(+)